MLHVKLLFLTLAAASVVLAGPTGSNEDKFKMPDGFLFGGGTASYQTEGAWHDGGKGINVFDSFFHKNYSKVNGDIACDFFHRYKEDIQIAADLKFNVFRFSISWTRIFPSGDFSEVNQDGVKFYHDVINEIRKHHMKPLCTIYHFDHPQAYEDEFDGWLSEKMIDKYLQYAKFILQNYGDKVDLWTSINEPNMHCSLVYNGIMPPGIPGQRDARKVYKCIHHEIIAHAKAFKYFKEEYTKTYPERPAGMFGIGATSMLSRPKSTGLEDQDAANRTNMFDASILLHPLVHGDYPPIVRATLEAQGRGAELPTFTDEERNIIIGSLDYIGFNAYAGRIVAAAKNGGGEDNPADATLSSMVGPMSDSGATDVSGSNVVTPWLLRDVALYVKDHYGDQVKVFFTENGLSTPGEKVDDWNIRAVYHSQYLRELFRAINEDKANVFGYTVWAFLDGFEFSNGFQSESGLIYIDYANASLPRTPKASTAYLKKVAEQRYASSVSNANQHEAKGFFVLAVAFLTLRVVA